MADAPSFKWSFPAYFRAKAFGWRGSRLACQRIKEAIAEIKQVHRQDPLLAAEGAVVFLEKVAPALEQIDSSSGAVGTAVNRAMEALVPLISSAAATKKERERWLERLWTAVEKEDMGYLDNLGDQWGVLCGGPDLASDWADRMVDAVRHHWADREKRGYYQTTSACLSCLLTAGRHEELLNLLETAPFRWWEYHKFGFQALVAMGKPGEALAYAQAAAGQNDQLAVDQACENLLIAHGMHDQAYERYALRANVANTRINTFRAIAKKYPRKEPSVILRDLIASTPGEEGKWFATARQLGFLDLALDLANRSPCDPLTLNRAARDFLADKPEFALGVALASLRWLCEGYGYGITNLDVLEAHRLAVAAADRIGKKGQIAARILTLVTNDRSKGKFVQKTLGVPQSRR